MLDVSAQRTPGGPEVISLWPVTSGNAMATVADERDVVLVQADGRVHAPREQTRAKLGSVAGRFRLVSGPPGLLLMRQVESSPMTGARVLMAGEIVSPMTVLEVVNMIGTANWRGHLHVYGEQSHRALVFDHGALKAASSNVPQERLGAVLVARGALDEEQLGACLAELSPSRRLGQVVTDKGYVENEALFGHLQVLMEKIFEGALLLDRGAFVFIRPADDAPPPPVMFHMPIQNLLMHGVQRLDEMALFRQHIPSGDMCPMLTERAHSLVLEEPLQHVAELITGERSILAIAQQLGWDEYSTTKAVHQLLQAGYVKLENKRGLDDMAAEHLLTQFAEVMTVMFDAAAMHSNVEALHARLSEWIQNTGYYRYFGNGLLENGTFDVDRVTQALRQSAIQRPLETLHMALHELSAFAMFAVSPMLPRAVEVEVARAVNARLKTIRL